MRFRKPELIPLLFIISAQMLLLGLGIWQVERLQWKSGLIMQIGQAQARPALTSLPLSLEGLEYRKAVLKGRFLEDKTLHFIGQKTDGYVWLVPFQPKDSDQVVMVSVGWFPAHALTEPLANGVTGILRPPRGKRLFSPENQPERNLWFTEDISAMEKVTRLKLAPLILDAGSAPQLRNDHLGYAITWFSLAVIAIVMFVLYHRIADHKP